MKKLLLTLSIAIASYSSLFAQWTNSGSNIYTSTLTNNVGIGTINPNSKLYVAGGGRNGLMIDGSLDGTATSKYISIWQGLGGIGIDPIGTGVIYLGYDQPSNILFGGSSANGVWKSSGNVGIGTTNPSAKLQVNYVYTDPTGLSINGGGSTGTALAIGGSAGDAGTSVVKIAPDWNTNASPYALDISPGGTTGANTRLLNISYSGSNKMVVTKDGAVGIGTTSPDALLTVNGTIHSKEVKVTSTVPVPDYVFDPEYKLTKLSELKSFLETNHHLPEIPSAKVIEKDGINLGDMNLKLLKKVEELTLYLIEKDEQLMQQRQNNQSQQDQINELKQQLIRITKPY